LSDHLRSSANITATGKIILLNRRAIAAHQARARISKYIIYITRIFVKKRKWQS